MAKDVWFKVPSSEYNEAMVLSLYNGKVSICAGKWNKNAESGGAFLQFAKYRAGKDAYQDKDWPVRVNAGTPQDAIYLLRLMADVLEGKMKPPEQPKPYVNSDQAKEVAKVFGGKVVEDDIGF